MLVNRQRLVDLLVPGQAVTANLVHERIGIELLDVKDTLSLPFAGEDHLRAEHRGNARSVRNGLRANFLEALGVVAVVPHIVGAFFAVFDTSDLAADGSLSLVAFA